MPGGRPRKPTKLKVLEGNRGKRKLNPDAEPQPAAGIPPSAVSGRAAEIRGSLVPELDRMGLLSQVDGVSLDACCRGAAQAEWADQEAEKTQATISAGKGEQNDFYRLGILNALSKKGWSQWGAFSQRFGLDPASRGKLSVGDSSKRVDPLDAALVG